MTKSDEMSTADIILNIAVPIGTIFRVPVKNIERDIKGVINTYKDFVNDMDTTIEGLKQSANKGFDDSDLGTILGLLGLNDISKDKGAKNIMAKLEIAYNDKNYSGVKTQLNEMRKYANDKKQEYIDKGETQIKAQKSAYSYIKGRITDKYKEAYQKAYKEKNSRECARIRNIILQYKEFYRYGYSVDKILTGWRKEA